MLIRTLAMSLGGASAFVSGLELALVMSEALTLASAERLLLLASLMTPV